MITDILDAAGCSVDGLTFACLERERGAALGAAEGRRAEQDCIASTNLRRRNLTKGQQAMALAMLYPDPQQGGIPNLVTRVDLV